MKIKKYKNWEYWYDTQTRVWWAAKYDKNNNQTNDAINAPNQSTIKLHMDLEDKEAK